MEAEVMRTPNAIKRTVHQTDRDLVLGAIESGCHTAREIASATNLNLSTVIREAELMQGLYVTILEGPPCVSYWIKGREPKGKLVRQAGHLIELPRGQEDDDVKADRIAAANARAIDFAKAASLEVIEGDEFRELPLERVIVHPRNVRGTIDTSEKSFTELVASVRAAGIQQPLIVTPNDGQRYRTVMGNRRRMAAAAAGLSVVPCIIRQYPSEEDEIAVMMIENIQRQGLRPMAEARAFRTLYLTAAKDIHAVARQTGLTQTYIYTRLRLLKLIPVLQEMVDKKEISPASGAIVAALDHDQQAKLVSKLPRMKLTAVKEIVDRLKSGALPPPKWKPARDRVTSDEEQFTRSKAIRDLTAIGDTWFNARHIRESFDDVCLDTCAESKGESYCHACPVPRFIASILRRTGGAENGR
jgi:ParB family transcriptional regulator, chromosome partitioning protein